MPFQSLGYVSREETLARQNSDTVLNLPSGPPGMIHQVLVAAAIAFEGVHLNNTWQAICARGVGLLLAILAMGVSGA